jgi:hypothetical protein
MQPIYPFRWDITKRSQLGRLLDEPVMDPDVWLQEEVSRLRGGSGGRFWVEYARWIEAELLRATARTLGYAGNSDLYFVGRSPESLFDYLSGLLLATSWAERSHLLHFSMSYTDTSELAREYPAELGEMRRYLTHLQLDPAGLLQRDRPVAFVDIVVSGRTLGNLIRLLHGWAGETGADWKAIQRKIHLVGLTERTETSPKTWRWQQHAPWVALLMPGAVKNVSIPADLLHYLGGQQAKVTQSFPPWRWADPSITLPQYDPPTLMALRRAVAFFDAGRTRAHRQRFARALSRQPAMAHAWFRDLVHELNH